MNFTIDGAATVVQQSRARQKAPPISLALTRPERATFEAEARRRGLGLSTTIRALAVERASEIERDRQFERARRWQTERLRELAQHIEARGFEEATETDVEAVFADALEDDRGGSPATG